MQITAIEIHYTKPKPGRKYAALKGYASVTFMDCLVINDIKVIDTEAKQFLEFPQSVFEDRPSRSIAHPTNSEFRKAVTDAVFKYMASDENNPLNTTK